MESSEYANLARLEQRHWYYVGKRQLVHHWLQRFGPPRVGQVLLDCGAGTGQFASEIAGGCRVFVLDDHEEALRLLRERFAEEQILSLTGNRIPLPDSSVDYITALDVLEHVQQDAEAVSGFARILKPGGVAVVTVPASMSLWSDWDESLHHFRRYDAGNLAALFPSKEWDLLHVNYTNVLAFPAVWLLRRWRRKAATKGAAEIARAEDRVPPSWLNDLLRWLFVSTGRARLRFPFGVSLLLVARRR